MFGKKDKFKKIRKLSKKILKLIAKHLDKNKGK